eukprot:TRINITY_DN581_c0_g1_i1.p1 TRINITY_DN581_c0_g1~~TRINITY_DN581_c0_g1_i1.p1  ORF type:complete len:525 (-),score=189.01 TRINITY_DN581_c0_g1_i1:1265-2839(-)
MKLFRGKFVTQIICSECKNISEREEVFSDISLQVKDCKSITESLSMFVSEEQLDKENQYFCEKCNKKVDAVRRVRIRRFPPVLTLGLNRFEMDWNTMDRKKLNDRLEFPLELSITGFKEFPEDAGEDEYELKAVVIHRGGAYGGHYHAYIRDELKEGNWKLKVPEKYTNEAKAKVKTVNKGINKFMEQNPKENAKMKVEEKNEELQKVTQEIEFNYDECDFPLPYANKELRQGWFDFDDESVTEIPFGRLQKQFGSLNESAYMLVYKQKKLTPIFADPTLVPECWIEPILTQNELEEQQREFYKSEDAQIEVVFQSSDLFTFDEELMIKYKVDKQIENQGVKVKIAKLATISQLLDKFHSAVKEKPANPLVYEIVRCKNEFCQVIRKLSAVPMDTPLEKAEIQHLSTWMYCEKGKEEVLEKIVGVDNVPIEVVVRFLGDDLSIHTYGGVTLEKFKEMMYERTSFPVEQQSIKIVKTDVKLIPIEDLLLGKSEKEVTLTDLKFSERTQLLLDVRVDITLAQRRRK